MEFSALKHDYLHEYGPRVKAESICKHLKDSLEKVEEKQKKSSLLYLTEDCLLHIFSFLSITEQLKLSKLCRRLRDIFEITFKNSKKITFQYAEYKHLKAIEISKMLQQFGPLIHEIKFGSDNEVYKSKKAKFLSCALQFCPNVKCLNLCKFVLNLDNCQRMVVDLRNITALKLIKCSVTDEMCFVLSQVKTIDVLDLSRNPKLKGKNLIEFRNLKQLYLSECYSIIPNYFSGFCIISGSKLKILDISGCYRLNTAAFSDLSTELNDLEALTMSLLYQTKQLALITKLKRLKSLTLCTFGNIKNLDDAFFEELIKNKSETLEELTIEDLFLTDKPKRYIFELKQLKNLSLKSVQQIDDRFLYEIANKLNLKKIKLANCKLKSKQEITSSIDVTKSVEHLVLIFCRQLKSDLESENIEKNQRSVTDVTAAKCIGRNIANVNIKFSK